MEMPHSDLGPGFVICVQQAFEEKDLVQHFNRLYGCSLCQERTPIEEMAYKVTGKTESDLKKFFDFVRECVWDRIGSEVRESLNKDASNILQKEILDASKDCHP